MTRYCPSIVGLSTTCWIEDCILQYHIVTVNGCYCSFQFLRVRILVVLPHAVTVLHLDTSVIYITLIHGVQSCCISIDVCSWFTYIFKVKSKGEVVTVMKRIRVLVAKPGLDGHDRGAKVVARALRDAGMEVIYTGLRQTPEQIAEAALQEDVDCVGLSILSGAHMTLVPKVVQLLKENRAEDILITVGGIIPDEDAAELKKLGVAGVFGPGTPTQDIIEFIQSHASA